MCKVLRGVNCGVGGLHFRKQNDVDFKLQPGGDGLEPFATIDVPVGVCEATHAPVVEGDSQSVALWNGVSSSGVCWCALG